MELATAIQFLKRFGYMADTEDIDTVDGKADTVKDGLKKFQSYYGLEETGLLDEATIENMKKSRCSVKDMDETRNYTLVSK